MTNLNTVVELSESEQAICRYIAKRRFENNRSGGIQDQKIGAQSNANVDLNGFAGEFAFCKLHNILPDFSINVRRTNANDYDAILENKKIDVKTTEYPTGKLVAVEWKNDNVDLYALMTGEFPKYTFRGFMRREELRRPERLGTLGRGPTYIARQEELKPLNEVF